MAGQPSRATAAWQPAGPRTRRFRFGLSREPHDEAPLEPGATVGDKDRFRIDAFLGEGGMGRVYAAVRERDGLLVALKVLRRDRLAGDLGSEYLARFRQETAAAARVGHPGIIEMYGFEHTQAGDMLLSMELLHGESLEAWLNKPGRLSVGLNLLAGFADALDAAHRSQIVHRDVKPANLFIQQRGDGSIQPKVLDFGLAKISAPEHTQIETAAGTVLGTPYYLAPERALGKPLSPAADLYSLGVILYEMLTGQLPFDADNFMDILALHIRNAPLDPRQAVPDRVVPDGVARLAMVLLAKEPGDRPRSAAEVAARIRRLLQIEAETIGAYATGPRMIADADAATMHLHGVHERPTAAPVRVAMREVTAQETAPTIAPQGEAVADPMTVSQSVPTGSMAFAAGEAPARTRIDTTYGKDARAAKRKAARRTPLWWLPLGAGLGVAAVLGWSLATGSPGADDASAPAAEPAPAAVGASPQAKPQPVAAADAEPESDADLERHADPGPASAAAPQPEATAQPEAAEPEATAQPEVAAPARPTRKRSRPPRKRSPAPSPPPPEPEPPPPNPKPDPKPERKVDNDPEAWRIDE